MAFGNVDDWICVCPDCDEECIGRTPQQARKFLREHRAQHHPAPAGGSN